MTLGSLDEIIDFKALGFKSKKSIAPSEPNEGGPSIARPPPRIIDILGFLEVIRVPGFKARLKKLFGVFRVITGVTVPSFAIRDEIKTPPFGKFRRSICFKVSPAEAGIDERIFPDGSIKAAAITSWPRVTKSTT